jgi:hypothetical protein
MSEVQTGVEVVAVKKVRNRRARDLKAIIVARFGMNVQDLVMSGFRVTVVRKNKCGFISTAEKQRSRSDFFLKSPSCGLRHESISSCTK